jgi:hypothetical protein
MQRCHGCNSLVSRDAHPLIRKIFVFVILLAALVGLVRQFPFLWELAVAGAIGGIYWIFFRTPPESS